MMTWKRSTTPYRIRSRWNLTKRLNTLREHENKQLKKRVTDRDLEIDVIKDGGNALPYHLEDPYVREMFEAKLAEIGAVSTMPTVVYTEAGANMEVLTDD